jgi:transaldolase/glucose-6-phosphate isomerase
MSTAGSTATQNPLVLLAQYGQSVWLDYIRRSLITQGELKRLIDEDGLRGVTSNPAIFEKAITGSNDYADALHELYDRTHAEPKAIYETLAIKDIQDAANLLRPVYDRTTARDGYVSLEVSPHLAHDTEGTLEEARRLWRAIDRRNVMIKVPATPEGIPVIRRLLSEGINVNVTLMFALQVYETVAMAYVEGLEERAAAGGDVKDVASVASFFISRIDTLVDELLEARLKTAQGAEKALLQTLFGRVAIANAKLTYQRYQEIFSGPRWEALARKGARSQRVLWASTSTKNPNYRDVIYIEELIGPDTVNTVPPATLDAFRDHGRARASLEEDVEGASGTLEDLARAGISLDEVTGQLLREGLEKFAEPFEKLLRAIEQRCQSIDAGRINRQTSRLSPELQADVAAGLREWQEQDRVRRLWAREATLWTGTDESAWMGWLGEAEEQLENAAQLRRFGEEIKAEGFTHALLLGMGGSSLCPEVLKETFGRVKGFPELHVLDSTDPAQIRDLESRLDMAKTLFIVSSKSGTTLEPNIFKAYFFEKAKEAVGAAQAGSRFVAVTDPGSKLLQVAEKDGFRRVFLGVPSIGGRYSALSHFGMVPAAVMGLDVEEFLERTEVMVEACAGCVRAEENPGVVLGTILGALARKGRDKVTMIVSPGIGDLGAWLEQLLAESTGKEGVGLIPVDREALGPADVYGEDRVFVYVRLESAPDAAQEAGVAALEAAGQPVVRIAVDSSYDLGEEFFRWEIATAVAGAHLGINPFNQPDVEASKVATRNLTDEYERTGSLPAETPFFEEQGIALFTDDTNASYLAGSARERSIVGFLGAHLGRLAAGDYLALLAYVNMNARHQELLQTLRHLVRDRKRVATCLGFGPRFLHSTGQAYKGGPASGVFVQITCDDAADLPVPGQKYTFGLVKAAQARGDFQVLVERGRRALRVHLGADVESGLKALTAAVERALR